LTNRRVDGAASSKNNRSVSFMAGGDDRHQ
jgi:hypothetical protein